MYIPVNIAAYTPNTINNGFPAQANQSQGFFTAPNRSASGKLIRSVSPTFNDVWSQPRLFFNSITKTEQQFLINAIRFETSHLTSDVIKKNVLIQLNRVSHDVAVRVAAALGLQAPAPDPKFYHDNTTAGVSVFNPGLLKVDGLVVGFLTSTNSSTSVAALRKALSAANVDLVVVAETLKAGVNTTYSAADATGFDGIIVDGAAANLFTVLTSSTEFPSGRPLDILLNGFRWGKPVAVVGGNGKNLFGTVGIPSGDGVFVAASPDAAFAAKFLDGLKTFKFLNRFPLDS
jgi:catalase